MNERWYYTDPLKVLWMAERFGMKFAVELTKLPASSQLSICDHMVHIGVSSDDELTHSGQPHKALCLDCREDGDRYYIHPASMHLLDPQPDDIVKYKSYVGVVESVRDDGFIEYSESTQWVGDDGWIEGSRMSDVSEIIQRGCVQFMWPECEGA